MTCEWSGSAALAALSSGLLRSVEISATSLVTGLHCQAAVRGVSTVLLSDIRYVLDRLPTEVRGPSETLRRLAFKKIVRSKPA